ncbi:MAG: hypothetical protein K2Z81_22275 [Cyanobacteria bacterium]|nr:hypothetical protein [Cyanobacteriota bacterium]
MCCSAWPVIFSKTITGTWEVLVDDVVKHVIWYQNRVGAPQAEDETEGLTEPTFQWAVKQGLTGRSLDAVIAHKLKQFDIEIEHWLAEIEWRKVGNKPRTLKQARKGNSGNCLIIPILGRWESIRLLNTAETPNLLSDIDKAVELPYGESTWGEVGLGGSWSTAGDRIVFLQFDVYDIVIAERASRIGEVLGQINPAKRPAVNASVFNALETWYRCPVAVCCFRSADQAEAKPIGFAFEPTYPEKLFVYTLDGHDGNPPDLNARVQLDHTIFVGSFRTPKEFTADVTYSDSIPVHLRPYLLRNVMGMPLNDYMLNGDLIFDAKAVRQGYFYGVRKLPPFAPQRQEDQHIFRPLSYTNGMRSRYIGA